MRQLRTWKCTAIAVSLLICCASSGLAQARRKATGPIDDDVKAGVLTIDEALLYKAFLVYSPFALPPKYHPSGPVRDTSPVLWEVLAGLPKAHPSVQEYIRYMFASPKGRETLPVPPSDVQPLRRILLSLVGLREIYLIRTDASLETPEGHFRIHYATHGSNASTEDYVKALAQHLERSWTVQTDTLGFRRPDLGSDGRLDVYVWGIAYDGFAKPPLLGLVDPYVVLNRTLDSTRLQVAAAHELFHIVQYGYFDILNQIFEAWWMESSATFIEDEVFDEANDYVAWASLFLQRETHISIDSIPEQDGDGYSAVLINILLKERFNGGDPAIIREVLESAAGMFTSSVEAIASALSRRGFSLAEGFREFALWNLFTGSRHELGYYSEGRLFGPFTNFQGTQTIGLARPSTGEQSVTVDNLAANCYQIVPANDLGAPRTLVVKAARSSDRILGYVVVFRRGAKEIRQLQFGADNKATVKVSGFMSGGTDSVVLILSNGDEHFRKAATYSASLEQGLDLIFVIDTTGSMWDDIAAVKAAAAEIVSAIHGEIADYRVAVVDYRDFPVWPYGGAGDYPYRAALPFSSDGNAIMMAIQGLVLGWGADWQESVYSALVRAIGTEGLGAWRSGVKKSVILMGDAPPHDPEPFTGYTASSVVAAAEAVDPAVIYSVAIGGDQATIAAFGNLAARTQGKLFTAPSSSDVVKAVLEAIGGAVEPPLNRPPTCGAARASVSLIWPPDHSARPIGILNVLDPDGDAVGVRITGILQDEPVQGPGSGNTQPDGGGVGTAVAWVRAERSGIREGRVYRISFEASDGKGGQCSGAVLVCVPHDQGANTACVAGPFVYDSTRP